MSQGKKIIILFLSLLLPVIIFIFLKSFGKNQFAVKPLFQDSVSVPTECAVNIKTPYTIPDSVLSRFNINDHDSLTLIVFGGPANQKLTFTQLKRIPKETSISRMRYTTILEKQEVTEIKTPVITLPLDRFEFFYSCIFLLSGMENAVLIDSQGRIAGQYDLTKLDDADRLIMESKIILKEY